MSEMKRIALIVRWPTGGIRTHLKYLYRYLPQGRYEPLLVAPGGTETDYLLKNLGVKAEQAHLVTSGSFGEFAKAVWKVCLRKDVDLVHSHGFTSVAAAVFAARIARKPHVATIHDVVTDALRQRLGGLGLRGLNAMLALPDVVHAVGADAAENLRALPKLPLMRRPNIVAIRNGVDISQFSGVTPRGLKADLGLPPECFLAGFFGRFMAQKGFRVLVQAVELLRQRPLPRPLVVLAVGEGGFLREDREDITRRGLEQYFRFLPPMENPAPSLAALDCLIMPSKWEALSVLAMEALCLGTPLIASECIGIREVVAGTPARAVPVGDAAALAEAVHAEMLNSSMARSRAFAAAACEDFDVKKSALELDRLFSAVAAGSVP